MKVVKVEKPDQSLAYHRRVAVLGFPIVSCRRQVPDRKLSRAFGHGQDDPGVVR